MLDDPSQVHTVRSKRGYVVYTGKKNGVPVSIVVTLMGGPNMDFVVRELRAVVDGEIAMFRLGSCGSIHPDAPAGGIVVATEGSIHVDRNYDYFSQTSSGGSPYRICGPEQSHGPLTRHVLLSDLFHLIMIDVNLLPGLPAY